MINGNFTNLDTIVFDDGTEMIVNEYFNYLEKNIKSDDIRKCSYDAEKEIFTYYKGIRQYSIKVANNTRNLRVLLTLMSLEKEQRVKEDAEMAEKKRTNELLNTARSGKIESEESRQLYLEELKNEKISLIFNYGVDALKDNDFLHTIAIMLAVISGLGILFVIIALLGILFSINILLFIAALAIILPAAIYCMSADFNPFANLCWFLGRCLTVALTYAPNLVANLIRNRKMIRIINHKIKLLKDYSAPVQTNNIVEKISKTNFEDNAIQKQLNDIYVKIMQLDNKDKKALSKELLSKIKSYQKELKNIPKGLTTINENYLNNSFISYLTQLDNTVSSKLNKDKYIKSFDKMTSNLNKEILNTENQDNQMTLTLGK